tara:strand:- start:380 stop:577 length:198 start_codon:yes stop_codon:yes gene_type:complete
MVFDVPERSSSKEILTYSLFHHLKHWTISTLPMNTKRPYLGFRFLNEDTPPPILRDIKRATGPYQ